jgi:hypothetical protein
VRFYAGWTAVVLLVAGGATWIVLAVQAHERELDRRCAAEGGVRVKITDEKLCFTEDWRWVKI